MFKWLRSRSAPVVAQEPESVRQRVHRLEIELTELREQFEVHKLAFQRFQGKVYGHLGAPNRDALRRTQQRDETLEEFRLRMLGTGAPRVLTENQHGEH